MIIPNKDKQAKFVADNLKLGRKGRKHWTTVDEHEHLKKCLIEYRSKL